MSTTPRTVWRIAAFREIRNLPKLKKLEEDIAQAGADAAGEGFVAEVSSGRTRARAAVIATTGDAIRADSRDHILMGRALDAMKAHRLQ